MSSASDASTGCAVPVRWWRHPGALAVLHLQRAVFGALAGLPLALALAALLGGRGGGDALLLDDGGLLVPDVLRALRGSVRSLVAGPATALLAGVLAALAATAGLLDAMARPGPRPVGERVGAALVAVPPLLLAAMVTALGQGAAAWVVAACGVPAIGAASLGEPARDLALVGVGGLALLAASSVGAVGDLFAASVAGLRLGVADAGAVAWAALRARPAALLAAHTARVVTAAALVASSVLVAMRVGMRAAGDAALSLLVLEAALIAATCLRGSWLALALEAVSAGRGGTALPDDLVSSKTSPLLADERGSEPR